MKRIIAVADGLSTLVVRGKDIILADEIMTQTTRDQERHEHDYMSAASTLNGVRRKINWRHLVTNRIKFRHDDTRGPISATLNHAIY